LCKIGITNDTRKENVPISCIELLFPRWHLVSPNTDPSAALSHACEPGEVTSVHTVGDVSLDMRRRQLQSLSAATCVRLALRTIWKKRTLHQPHRVSIAPMAPIAPKYRPARRSHVRTHLRRRISCGFLGMLLRHGLVLSSSEAASVRSVSNNTRKENVLISPIELQFSRWHLLPPNTLMPGEVTSIHTCGDASPVVFWTLLRHELDIASRFRVRDLGNLRNIM
jgi:hypothetical protein